MKRKQLLSILTGTALVLSLAACGKGHGVQRGRVKGVQAHGGIVQQGGQAGFLQRKHLLVLHGKCSCREASLHEDRGQSVPFHHRPAVRLGL